MNKDGDIELSGKRYDSVFEDGRILPKFRAYAETKIGLNIECVVLLAAVKHAASHTRAWTSQ